MTPCEVRQTVASLTSNDVANIMATLMAVDILDDNGVGELIAQTLTKYEDEIVRLNAVNSKLRNKNRNYRSGIKNLQRAHEALLHRFSAVQDTSEQYRTLLVEAAEQHGGCEVGVCEVPDDAAGPYSPVRFNNEPVPVAR